MVSGPSYSYLVLYLEKQITEKVRNVVSITTKMNILVRIEKRVIMIIPHVKIPIHIMKKTGGGEDKMVETSV